MMDEELIKIWQSSPNQEKVKFDKSKMMMDVQSSVDRLHRDIRQRDLRETIAALIGIPVFAYYTYSIPYTLNKISSILIIIWGIYVIIKLRNAKRHQPGAMNETYLQYLYKTREYLHIQKQLLDNVLYWYILPAALLVFLFVLGPGVAGRVSKILLMGGLISATGIAIHYLNKQAVKKELLPRLAKIDELLSIMEKSS